MMSARSSIADAKAVLEERMQPAKNRSHIIMPFDGCFIVELGRAHYSLDRLNCNRNYHLPPPVRSGCCSPNMLLSTCSFISFVAVSADGFSVRSEEHTSE